jgi:hypothetical protein
MLDAGFGGFPAVISHFAIDLYQSIPIIFWVDRDREDTLKGYRGLRLGQECATC